MKLQICQYLLVIGGFICNFAVNMIYHLFTSLPFMVCGIAVIQLLLTARKRTSKAIRWLLLWAVATMLLYGCHFIYFNHFVSWLPMTDTLYTMTNLLVYPLFLLYISAVTDREPLHRQKTVQGLTVGIPLVAGIAVGWLYAAMNDAQTAQFISSYLYHGHEEKLTGLPLYQAWTHIGSHVVFAIQVACVIVLGFKRIRRFNRTIQQLYADTENKEIESIPTILILFIVTSLVSTVANVLGKEVFVDTVILGIPSLVFSILIFSLTWVGMQQDFTMRSIPEEQEQETGCEENTVVTPSANSILIYERLETMMREQQTFLNHDLLLNDVAKLLGTNRTYLLQALSSCAHMTFKEYINRKRIAYAEKLIAESPQTPKTEIAALSGYNSMSAFYRNFGLYKS